MTAWTSTSDTADVLARNLEAMVRQVAIETPSAVTDDVLDHTGLLFADTIGVIMAGSQAPELAALRTDPTLRLVMSRDSEGMARTVSPTPLFGDPVTVAWLNGTAGTFLELDEGYRPTGHPGIQVIPAALAAAEAARATGADLATAIVAGYEVAARCFEAFQLPRPMHPHGHFGGLGAATAVAMLAGADPVEVVRIAATQPLMTGWQACFDGATARNTWAGHANRVGVLALTLHRAGFTGSTASLASVVAPYLRTPTAIQDPVRPESLRIRHNYFKFHSACALTHSTLDALLEAWRRGGEPNPWDIARVDVTTVSANLRVAGLPRPNALSTRFSIPYAVAAALLKGNTSPSAFDWDPRVAEYATRVTVAANAAMDAAWPQAAPARVALHMRSGISEAVVDNPRGHHARPPSSSELRQKFESLLMSQPAADEQRRVRCSGPTPGESFDHLAHLHRVSDCALLALPRLPPA